jgi:hypothetical protein
MVQKKYKFKSFIHEDRYLPNFFDRDNIEIYTSHYKGITDFFNHEETNKMINNSYFKGFFIEKAEHPETKEISYILSIKIKEHNEVKSFVLGFIEKE